MILSNKGDICQICVKDGRLFAKFFTNSIQRKIKEENIIFVKHDGYCHFCTYNEQVLNLSDGMIETLKDQCKIHRITTLIKHTGLSEIVIKRWLKEHDSNFPKVSILGVVARWGDFRGIPRDQGS